jgi:hypothetical protein
MTEGIVEATGWQTVARIAAQKHRQDLRERKHLRRMGDTLTIKITKLKTSSEPRDGEEQ